MKILIVDDDERLLSTVQDYLSAKNFEVATANSGEKALDILQRERFDAAVLDVMMPFMDGIELLKRINIEYGYLPVIMLTAMGDETDRILGLELGADDYLVKPVSLRELVARIKAVTRRREKPETPAAHSGLLQLNLEKREAIFRGEILDLTSFEFTLLSVLFQNKGIVLGRDRIMDLARGEEFIACDRSIDVHISHLRQKLGDDPHNPSIIKTIRGVGYLFAGW